MFSNVHSSPGTPHCFVKLRTSYFNFYTYLISLAFFAKLSLNSIPYAGLPN